MRFLNILPAIAAVVSLASCSVYRQGQTPDDVYYSPVRAQESYVAADKKDNNRYNDRNDSYYNPDDNYLRMRVRDRYRWSSFDDYYYMNDWQYGGGYSPYYYSPYGYAYANPYMMYSPFAFNAYWNSYYNWNSFYNPYCPGFIVVSPKTNPVAYNNVRNFRLNSYTNNTYSNTNGGRGMMINSSRYGSANGRYNNANSYRSNNSSSGNNNSGGSLKRIFSNSNNNNSESYYNPSSSNSSSPVRSYQPSSSNSGSYTPSSSSGSSGSSGGRSSGGGGVSGSGGGRSGRGG